MTAIPIDEIGSFPLVLGRSGENNVTEIKIDCSTWLADYPDAIFAVFVKKPGRSVIYSPSNVAMAGNILRWTVTSADTSVTGNGNVEIRMYSGDKVKKSATSKTTILDSLVGSEVQPTQDNISWMDTAMEAEAERVAAENTREGRLGSVEGAVSDHASQLADSANWRKATGNPARFYPVPASSLAVKALLTAIQAGSGDPSPTNIRPISPAVAAGGTVKVKRTGKNVFDGAEVGKWIDMKAGEITSNPTAVTTSKIPCKSGDVFTLSSALPFAPAPGNIGCIAFYDKSNTLLERTAITTGNALTKTAPANTAYARAAANTPTADSKMQLELGSTASPYEPYAGDEYTLTAQQAKYGLLGAEAWLANDGSEGDPTELVTLTGSEAGWVKAGSNPNTYYLDYGGSGAMGNMVAIAGMCNQFKRNPAATTALADGEFNVLVYTTNPYRIIFRRDACTTVEEWKAFLAAQNTGNTPIVILRQRVAPATATGAAVSIPAIAQLDRYTPRQNLVTVDKGTPEVGYAKSPIRTEDELLAAIAALA